MKFRSLPSILCLLALLGAPALAAAQSALPTDWWCQIKGRDKGAGVLEFGGLNGSSFDVAGFIATVSLEDIFEVVPDQQLERDSRGRISGTLDLTGVLSGDTATLEMIPKRSRSTDTQVKLVGTLIGPDFVERVVRLQGEPLPTSPDDLSGRDVTAAVGRGGLRSRAYDFNLAEAPRGFPEYSIVGNGAVNIDRADEDENLVIGGWLVVAPGGRAVGGFSEVSSEVGVGDGAVSGSVRLPSSGDDTTTSAAPVARLQLLSDERRFRIRAELTELALGSGIDVSVTADPTSVTPPSGTVTFTLRIANLFPTETVEIISLDDSVVGDLDGLNDCAIFETIEPAGLYECTYDATVTGDDGDVEDHLVTVTVEDESLNEVTEQDTASVSITAP